MRFSDPVTRSKIFDFWPKFIARCCIFLKIARNAATVEKNLTFCIKVYTQRVFWFFKNRLPNGSNLAAPTGFPKSRLFCKKACSPRDVPVGDQIKACLVKRENYKLVSSSQFSRAPNWHMAACVNSLAVSTIDITSLQNWEFNLN